MHVPLIQRDYRFYNVWLAVNALNMPMLIHLYSVFLKKVKPMPKGPRVQMFILQFCKENVSPGLSFYVCNAIICIEMPFWRISIFPVYTPIMWECRKFHPQSLSGDQSVWRCHILEIIFICSLWIRLFKISTSNICTKAETADSFSPWRSGFSSRVLHIGFVIYNVLLGPVFLQALSFFQDIIPPMPCAHVVQFCTCMWYSSVHACFKKYYALKLTITAVGNK